MPLRRAVCLLLLCCCTGHAAVTVHSCTLHMRARSRHRHLGRFASCFACVAAREFLSAQNAAQSVEPYPNSVGRGLEDDSYLSGTLPLHKAEGKMAQVMKVDAQTQRPGQRQA